MANPIIYLNTHSTSLTAGSRTIPKDYFFVYDSDTGIVKWGDNLALSASWTKEHMDNHIGHGRAVKAFGGQNAYKFVNHESVNWEAAVNDITGEMSLFVGGYLYGYEYKLQRPARIYKDKKHILTLPTSANVIIQGNSVAGVSFNERTPIIGWRMSQAQAASINSVPGLISVFNNTVPWWVDAHVGTAGRSTKRESTLSGYGIGNLSGI